MNKQPENTSIQGNSPLAECWVSERDLLRERAFGDTLWCLQEADGCETQVLQSESESPRIRDSTCFHCLSITQPVPLFLPLISKTSWTWCWEIDELVKCISYDHKGLSLTPMTSVINWVWWCTLIIPTLGRWSVPGATWSSRSMKDSISKKGSQKLTTPKVVLCPLLVGLYIHTSQTPNQLSWAWPCVVFTVKDCSKGTGHCC